LVARHRELAKGTVIWEVERGARITGRELARPFFRKHEYSVLPATQAPPFAAMQEYPAAVAGVKMGAYLDWMKSCYYISAHHAGGVARWTSGRWRPPG